MADWNIVNMSGRLEFSTGAGGYYMYVWNDTSIQRLIGVAGGRLAHFNDVGLTGILVEAGAYSLTTITFTANLPFWIPDGADFGVLGLEVSSYYGVKAFCVVPLDSSGVLDSRGRLSSLYAFTSTMKVLVNNGLVVIYSNHGSSSDNDYLIIDRAYDFINETDKTVIATALYIFDEHSRISYALANSYSSRIISQADGKKYVELVPMVAAEAQKAYRCNNVKHALFDYSRETKTINLDTDNYMTVTSYGTYFPI